MRHSVALPTARTRATTSPRIDGSKISSGSNTTACVSITILPPTRYSRSQLSSMRHSIMILPETHDSDSKTSAASILDSRTRLLPHDSDSKISAASIPDSRTRLLPPDSDSTISSASILNSRMRLPMQSGDSKILSTSHTTLSYGDSRIPPPSGSDRHTTLPITKSGEPHQHAAIQFEIPILLSTIDDIVIPPRTTQRVWVHATAGNMLSSADTYYCTHNTRVQTPCLVSHGYWEGTADRIPILVTNPTTRSSQLRRDLPIVYAHSHAQLISTDTSRVTSPEPESRRGESTTTPASSLLAAAQQSQFRFSTPAVKVTQNGRHYCCVQTLLCALFWRAC